jgi:hypothetical protein
VYLSRSSHRETVKAFGEVIGRLRGGGKPSSSELLGAFEAEGLLSLCAVLVKVLKVDWLFSHWSSYAPTLQTYLGHQASTVRQSASRIFFYVMAKDGGDLGLARLILAALTGGWLVPISPRADVQRRAPESHAGAGTAIGTFEESLAAANMGAHIWEWKEGRLLAYELVLNGLLNNHTSSIFPTLHGALSPRTLPSPRAQPSSTTEVNTGHGRVEPVDAIVESCGGGCGGTCDPAWSRFVPSLCEQREQRSSYDCLPDRQVALPPTCRWQHVRLARDAWILAGTLLCPQTGPSTAGWWVR